MAFPEEHRWAQGVSSGVCSEDERSAERNRMVEFAHRRETSEAWTEAGALPFRRGRTSLPKCPPVLQRAARWGGNLSGPANEAPRE